MPNKDRISDTEMFAAIVIVCMIAFGIYFSHTIDEKVQAQIEKSME